MSTIFEKMGGTYTMGKDGMYYPNLTVPAEEPARYGKYGMLRLTFLKSHRPALYTTLLATGKLTSHLNEIDNTASERVALITRQMAENQGVNEALKDRAPMEWVSAMNNIRNAAEEIVLTEVVFA